MTPLPSTGDLPPSSKNAEITLYSGENGAQTRVTGGLSQLIDLVVQRLLGEPNRRLSTRTELRYGSKGALAVAVSGPKRGTWFDHSEGVGGGVLDLIVRHRGGDRRAALQWLKDGFGANHLHPSVAGAGQSATELVRQPRHARLAAWALPLWRSCRRITADDLAGRYLAARGCAFPHADGDLRWHPALPHPCGHRGPALIGLVTDVADPGRPLNLHKTWIDPNAAGRKAFDDFPKDERPQARLVLKNHTTTNGCIRLWPDCEVNARLTVGEGVESCLAAARTHWPAWSCLNAGNVKVLPVLAGIEALTIACDHDPGGIAAAREVGARWQAAGRDVHVLFPTRPKTDWADVVVAMSDAVRKPAA